MLDGDWVCETHSPSTHGYDLIVKRRFYAGVGVCFLWYVDPEARTLTASRLHEGKWLEVGLWCGDERVRAEPFEALELDLATLWEGLPPQVVSDGSEAYAAP